MLEVRGLAKRFHGIPAVADVSFNAPPGEITALLGPNGSGKSTTFRMITGLIEPSTGEILYRGVPIATDLLAHKQRLGYVPEEPHLYPHLTGAEYLELVGQLRGMASDRLNAKIEQFLRLLSLWSDRYTFLSEYSKGMKQKVLIAAALLDNPEIVLLDEPFTGLDVTSAMVLRELVRSLAAAGKVVVFSSHVLHDVERLSSTVVILHRGRVAACGSVGELRDLMKLPSLEEIFAQLAVEQNPAATAAGLVAAMEQ